MRRTVKIITAIVMALTLAVLCMPVSFAAEKSGQCGDVTWTFNEESGEIVFSGNGVINAYPVDPEFGEVMMDEDGNPKGTRSFEDIVNDIKTIKISEGVTEIGGYAFQDCTQVTSVELPETLTGICDNAFAGCTSLSEIEIPGKVEFGGALFAGCTSLRTVKLNEGITSIPWYVFVNCENLSEIYIPESIECIDTSAVEGVNDPHFIFPGTDEQFAKINFDEETSGPIKYKYSTQTTVEKVVNENADGTFEEGTANENTDGNAVNNENNSESESTFVSSGYGVPYGKVAVIVVSAVIICALIIVIVLIVVKGKGKNKNKEYKTK